MYFRILTSNLGCFPFDLESYTQSLTVQQHHYSLFEVIKKAIKF